MRILFFSEQSPFLRNRVGGAENSMRLIAEGMAARGHEVTYASLRPDMVPFARETSVNGVRLLLCPGPRRSLRARLGRRLEQRLGLRPGRIGASLDAAAWARVRRRLFGTGAGEAGADGRRRFDLLYAFYEMDFLDQALAARAAEAAGMVIVLRMAGVSWHDAILAGGGPGSPAAARYDRVFNGVDAINYLSDRSRALVEAKAAEAGLGLAPGFGPRGAFVADIGVDVGRVARSWDGPSPGPGLEILVATRFSRPQKRQDLLIEALGLLRDRLAFRVTMVGIGETVAEVTRRRDALGLADRVEIRPFLPQDALWAAMRRADLLCHPCDHEGVSKIILESMMLGLPVLASDVPPLPDYVIEGETGYRVANTPEAWAAKLLEIAARKDRLPALSTSARAFVETTYDTGRNIGLYEARFRELTEDRPGMA